MAYSGKFVRQDGIYGGIHIHDGSTAQEIDTGTTYEKITLFTDNSYAENVTPDVANDKITITIPGRYRVAGQMSFSSGTANVVWWGAAFWNGVEQDQVHFKRKTSTSNDVGSASLNGFVDVTSVPTDVDFRVRHDNGAGINFTLEYGNINVEYVGET